MRYSSSRVKISFSGRVRCLTQRRSERSSAFSGLAVGTGRVPSSICRSVRLLVTTVYCARMAEAIDLPFGVVGLVGLRNGTLDGRAHWHYLANTVERLCTAAIDESANWGGDASCS